MPTRETEKDTILPHYKPVAIKAVAAASELAGKRTAEKEAAKDEGRKILPDAETDWAVAATS